VIPFYSLWFEVVRIWTGGGWAMSFLALVSLLCFGLGVRIHRCLRRKRIPTFPELDELRQLRVLASRGETEKRIFKSVIRGDSRERIREAFDHFVIEDVLPLERDLGLLKICVGIAPLVGLLGTVTGMLVTFAALASGSGGQQTMSVIAGGISEALITTETGLVIALPALFFFHRLQRALEEYKDGLAHLEAFSTRASFKRTRDLEKERFRRAAVSRITRALQEKSFAFRFEGWEELESKGASVFSGDRRVDGPVS